MIGPEEFQPPTGDLTGDMFPGEDLDDVISELLAQGYGVVTTLPEAQQDEAVRHYVLSKAYRRVGLRLAMKPATATLQDAGSITYGTTGSKRFLDLAAEEWRQYQFAINATTTGNPRSGYTRTRFTP